MGFVVVLWGGEVGGGGVGGGGGWGVWAGVGGGGGGGGATGAWVGWGGVVWGKGGDRGGCRNLKKKQSDSRQDTKQSHDEQTN